MKNDELCLLLSLQERGDEMRPTALELAMVIGIPYKRARYILRDKWTKKNWYEYGVSWRVGWLTQEGKNASPFG